MERGAVHLISLVSVTQCTVWWPRRDKSKLQSCELGADCGSQKRYMLAGGGLCRSLQVGTTWGRGRGSVEGPSRRKGRPYEDTNIPMCWKPIPKLGNLTLGRNEAESQEEKSCILKELACPAWELDSISSYVEAAIEIKVGRAGHVQEITPTAVRIVWRPRRLEICGKVSGRRDEVLGQGQGRGPAEKGTLTNTGVPFRRGRNLPWTRALSEYKGIAQFGEPYTRPQQALPSSAWSPSQPSSRSQRSECPGFEPPLPAICNIFSGIFSTSN